MPDPLCHATQVKYNNLYIKNVLTESLSSETVYDRFNVDPIGVRTRMVFVAEIYGHPTQSSVHHGLVWKSAKRDDLAFGLRDAIDKFLTPRKQLIITMGKTTLFNVIASQVSACESPQTILGGDIKNQDIANGPRTTCQILAVRGDRAAKCRFSVEFTLPLACGATLTPDILNVRWQVNDDIECQSWLTTRTYTGAIRFRTRYVNPIAPAHTPHYIARAWCLPPLLRGFRRESISYHEDPNGLEITFSIVDQELYSAAPSPATFWDGTYTMTLGRHAAFCTQDLSFVLKGDKLIHKAYLMTLATYIIDAKMAFRFNRPATEKAPNRFLLSAMFQEKLNANEIRAAIQVWSSGADAVGIALSQGEHLGPGGVPIKNTFAQDLPTTVSMWSGNPRIKEYDPEVTTVPQEFSAGVSLMLAALQTPCCVLDMGTQQKSAATNIYIESPSRSLQPSPIVYNRTQQLYDEMQNKASYAYYRMQSDIMTDTGWRGFPLGSQCTSYGSNATTAFARLHCPVQIRKITINAQRINAWPELPKQVHWIDNGVDGGITHVLRNCTIEPLPVQLSADGCDSMHEVLATYYYYLNRPYPETSYFPVGRTPMVSKAQLAAKLEHEVPGVDGDKRQIAPSFFIDPAEFLQSFKVP